MPNRTPNRTRETTRSPDAGVAIAAPSPTLLSALLAHVPHVVGERDLVWLDLSGLPVRSVAAAVLDAAARTELPTPRLGISRVPLVAEVAARDGDAGRTAATARRPITIVRRGHERDFLHAHPLTVLEASSAATDAWSPRLASLIADLGLTTCHDLAAVSADAVEVRLGGAGAALWHLARGDDARRIFGRRVRARPAASLAWTEYELRDPSQLIFGANRLLDRVCAELVKRGEQARALTLALTCGDGSTLARELASARPTADRARWMRSLRADLERLPNGALSSGVVGIALEVAAAEPAQPSQGDLFDRGFESGTAAEAAIARLLDRDNGQLVAYRASGHALPEQRLQRSPAPASVEMVEDARRTAGTPLATRLAAADATLALNLLDTPLRITVTTRSDVRHAHMPVAYQTYAAGPNGHAVAIYTAAGPDRVCAGLETGTLVCRDYWHCTTDDQFVLLYRDAAADATREGTGESKPGEDAWYLHGWWS